MSKLTTTPSLSLLQAENAHLREQLTLAHQQIAILQSTGPTCVLCPNPATTQDGDWDLCESCHSQITAWPVCPCGVVLTPDDVELGKEQCEDCRQAGASAPAGYSTFIIFPGS